MDELLSKMQGKQSGVCVARDAAVIIAIVKIIRVMRKSVHRREGKWQSTNLILLNSDLKNCTILPG